MRLPFMITRSSIHDVVVIWMGSNIFLLQKRSFDLQNSLAIFAPLIIHL